MKLLRIVFEVAYTEIQKSLLLSYTIPVRIRHFLSLYSRVITVREGAIAIGIIRFQFFDFPSLELLKNNRDAIGSHPEKTKVLKLEALKT
ncbi:hypothetical protein IQ249_07335 [Lusitaniella coriacea LEGE 07157]|uniref:Uncharacterized protein n=1 Tax=Lusitaniella coriacea LEGE 07157 TaxID=945747 RepID=A0A8J7DVD9_9CYAN|nr:hypothetical protein [Lusitaniella coriacea]MBE9115703.1 hypothetical protein [Lusitaniella coriacea LEGE 07157]